MSTIRGFWVYSLPLLNCLTEMLTMCSGHCKCHWPSKEYGPSYGFFPREQGRDWAKAHPIVPARSRAGGQQAKPSSKHWAPPWRWKWARNRMRCGSTDEPGRAGPGGAAEQPCRAVAGQGLMALGADIESLVVDRTWKPQERAGRGRQGPESSLIVFTDL